MSFWDFLFFNGHKMAQSASQGPHDTRDDETVDPATGIGEADGQILDNTEIDPDIQDREKGFPK